MLLIVVYSKSEKDDISPVGRGVIKKLILEAKAYLDKKRFDALRNAGQEQE